MMPRVKAARPVPLALLLAALAGCPDAGKTGPDGVAPIESATVAPRTTGEAPKDPLAGSVFSREEVLEVFFAEQAAGRSPSPETEAARLRALKKHRLVDEEGREVPARARAYERALQALAADAEAWAAEIEARDR